MWDPYDPISYLLHVAFGFLAMAGAVTALSVVKGSPLHKKAGWLFAVPMAVAAVTALVFEIEFEQPRPLVVIMSAATLYLLASSLLAIRNRLAYARILEKVLIVVPIALFAIAALILVRSVGSGSLIRVPGQTLYAGIFLALLIGDIRIIVARPDSRIVWIKRHLLRMLLAFGFAIRAILAIAMDVGLPFQVVVTAPLVAALLVSWYFFATMKKAPRNRIGDGSI